MERLIGPGRSGLLAASGWFWKDQFFKILARSFNRRYLIFKLILIQRPLYMRSADYLAPIHQSWPFKLILTLSFNSMVDLNLPFIFHFSA